MMNVKEIGHVLAQYALVKIIAAQDLSSSIHHLIHPILNINS